MEAPLVRRRILQGLGLLLLTAGGSLGLLHAQSVDLASLQVSRHDGAVTVDFVTRVTLPRTVEDALQRGVPVYFVAQAQLFRTRWYWRDERVARISRSWRVAFQPLTSTWRVGLGGLNQSYPTFDEAMAAASRSAGWKLADANQLDPDSRYYVEFSWRLDNSQLPSPMQIGLPGNSDWSVGVERTLRLD